MLPRLEDIKKMRNNLGITQKELAKASGVSQSLIAKIEQNSIVPSYENARNIFGALESMASQKAVRAKDVMNPKIKTVHYNDSVKKAITIMRHAGISQLPVMKANKNVGTLSEENIIDAINKNIKLDSSTKVKEIMGDALPAVGEDTPLKLLSDLLDHNLAVLITKAGRIKGIVTKSDLLKSAIK